MEDSTTWLYDADYGASGRAVYASIRAEAFGEDIGQNSWLTADEQREFCTRLALNESSVLLEVAGGSGGPALFTATVTGCQVVGVDIHADGVATANAAALERAAGRRVRFLLADARKRLPFEDASFDAVQCIDAMNHIYQRQAVLTEWYRLVRPGGRILFTNPIVVTGLLRREEMLLRSGGMGEFVFTPPGVDEALLAAAGFVDIEVTDATASCAQVATAWYAARARREADLRKIEGADEYEETQRFYETAATLHGERRLSRLVFCASRGPE